MGGAERGDWLGERSDVSTTANAVSEEHSEPQPPSQSGLS
jgi:hypothetical protein